MGLRPSSFHSKMANKIFCRFYFCQGEPFSFIILFKLNYSDGIVRIVPLSVLVCCLVLETVNRTFQMVVLFGFETIKTHLMTQI